MVIERHNPKWAVPPVGNSFSHVVRVDAGETRLIVVSGQMALNEAGDVVAPGDMAQQTERVFSILDQVLADEGASFADVVQLRTYVTDMTKISDYGRVRAQFLGSNPPASATVEVSRLYQPEALVEVELVAAVPLPQAAGPL